MKDWISYSGPVFKINSDNWSSCFIATVEGTKRHAYNGLMTYAPRGVSAAIYIIVALWCAYAEAELLH